jgi:hypothetical protein
MVFAIGMHLAETASEHWVVFLGIIAAIWLVLLWPRIVRFIEGRSRRH